MKLLSVLVAVIAVAAVLGPRADHPVAAVVVPAAAASSTAVVQLKRPVHADAPNAVQAPTCQFGDTPATAANWRTVVLDTHWRLPASYELHDLVDTGRAGLNGGHLVRRLVLADLRAMVYAARAAGVALAVQSAFRSFGAQRATFAGWVARSGPREARRFSARPGHSEHQLGTAIDFRSAGGVAPWTRDWARTPEGAWLATNGWRFGWVMSYPRGARTESCYGYEPWHYRYVGRELAAAIHASGRTPRAFLWQLGTSSD